jgi:hypothetical protein
LQQLSFLSDGPIKIIGDFVKFELFFNTGAAFSFGNKQNAFSISFSQ